MKVTILEFPDRSDWIAVKKRALVTVGLTSCKDPTDQWKHDILNARHSPIRRLRFSFLLTDIPYYVSVHLCRHIHAQPYVKSQRSDRQKEQGYIREKKAQDEPVTMIWDMGGEELLTVFNKRLCGCADPTTRKLVRMIADAVIERDPIYKPFAVPMCKYLGRCPEMFPCKECKP